MKRITARTAFSAGLFAAAVVFVGSCAPLAQTVTELVAPGGARIVLPHRDSVVNLVALRARIDALPMGAGHTRMRIASTTACSNCGTAVEIVAYAGAMGVGPNRPPSAPQAVARMTNIGPYPTQMYSMKTSAEAYYIVIAQADSAGRTEFVVAEVPTTGATGLVRRVAKGGYRGCGHGPPKKNVADFRSCTFSSSLPEGILRLASQSGFEGMIGRALMRASAAMAISEDPGWVSCIDGCCLLEPATN